ncbi:MULTISPECIES: enoyl-CoA hydratase/isomerase family protein [Kordiimonas]|jgi:isohexenylglutaconyl-CoA hydratase|uniref:enoyl-CoA hydratase/isomerase family protein n=1 Tax=Kordiimonas TaxID=288021 RepID=UPI00257B67E0|nr:enoyl-CoA hydratase-related protein [Kordiimonas sp. UBA4487]
MVDPVLITQAGGVMYVTLNRPEVKNAMNFAMVDALMAAFDAAEADDSVRVMVMRGANGVFCAGGDLKDFSAGGKNADDIAIGNRRFGTLMERTQRFPKLLVTFVRGAAMGGGFGLVCVSDIAIAEDSCRFGMPEVTLGLIPAQIAPFVRARIGLTETRKLALTGEIITGKKAKKLGLVHHSEPTVEAMDHRLLKLLEQARKAAPGAVAATKKLLMGMGETVTPDTLDDAAKQFAISLRHEGAEGTRAFVEKRPPSWMEGDA